MQYLMKEMGIAEILDQGVAIFRNHFKLLLGITGYLLIPFYVLQNLVQYLSTPIQVPGQPSTENPGLLVLNVLLFILLTLVVSPLTNGAIIHAAANEYLDRPTTAGKALRASLKKWSKLVGTSIYAGLIILLGFLLFFIPGIYFAFRYSFISQVVMIEDTSGGAALKRSGVLMKENYSKAFVLGFLLGVISMGVSLIAGILPFPLLRVFLVSLIQVFVVILYAAAYVAFYFSTRCQHENFDLALLAQQVGEEVKSEPANLA
ncbi:MAG: hypothetical protein V1918_04285 [Planctomycetota bacterium]